MGKQIVQQTLVGFAGQESAFKSSLRNSLNSWIAAVQADGLSVGIDPSLAGLSGMTGGFGTESSMQARGGNTVNNTTFSPTINNQMDWEEFVFGVQCALQTLGDT
jgi:hypothetical protein